MKRFLSALLIALPSLSLVACSSNVTGGEGRITKGEARLKGGIDAQGNDICAAEGWYSDGTCDDFCPEVDQLDCPVMNQCPSPDDPAVHYVSNDPSACQAALFACTPEQTQFNSPECGCGCIDTAPPGPFCGGIDGAGCAAGYFCNFPIETMCGAGDQGGTCEPIAEACPEYYGPVCGCDGKTYDNPCFAHAAGVSVLSSGACGSGAVCGGLGNLPCAAGEFCNYPLDAICGAADASGICAPKPEACDQVLDPVCGCDSMTYSNACMANLAGVSVSAAGACP